MVIEIRQHSPDCVRTRSGREVMTRSFDCGALRQSPKLHIGVDRADDRFHWQPRPVEHRRAMHDAGIARPDARVRSLNAASFPCQGGSRREYSRSKYHVLSGSRRARSARCARGGAVRPSTGDGPYTLPVRKLSVRGARGLTPGAPNRPARSSGISRSRCISENPRGYQPFQPRIRRLNQQDPVPDLQFHNFHHGARQQQHDAADE